MSLRSALELILATVREHGVVRLFGTSLRGEVGSSCEVEISCAAVSEGLRGQLGFVLRDVGRRMSSGQDGARCLTQTVEQHTALVGRVSLRNLVRDMADMVERHLIEAALASTGENRTLAADVLGVSRQSLCVKLRRYTLGGPAAATATQAASKALPRQKTRIEKKSR